MLRVRGRVSGWLAVLTVTVMLVSGSAYARQAWRGGGGQRSQPRIQAQPQRHAGQWLRQHQNMSPAQQRKALENDPQFQRLPAERQQQLRDRLQRFDSRSPEERKRILNRMETWEHLTPEQKGEARQLHDQMQQLSPDRRQAVTNEIQTLRGMPPAARERTLNSDAVKGRFSPQEQDMLNNASKLPLAAPAQPPAAGQGPQ